MKQGRGVASQSLLRSKGDDGNFAGDVGTTIRSRYVCTRGGGVLVEVEFGVGGLER